MALQVLNTNHRLTGEVTTPVGPIGLLGFPVVKAQTTITDRRFCRFRPPDKVLPSTPGPLL